MTGRAAPPRTAVRRLALGRLISMTGTFAAAISLTFVLYERTGSARWISATALLTWGIPGFLGPLAGAVADRFDRRRLMIVTEVAALVCWVALSLAREPAAMLALAFVASVLLTPYLPASGAAIPNVAGVEQLSWANSLMAVGRYAALTLGPLVGGVLVSVGPGVGLPRERGHVRRVGGPDGLGPGELRGPGPRAGGRRRAPRHRRGLPIRSCRSGAPNPAAVVLRVRRRHGDGPRRGPRLVDGLRLGVVRVRTHHRFLAYAVGGVFGLIGTALLLPLRRYLPARENVEVEPEVA